MNRKKLNLFLILVFASLLLFLALFIIRSLPKAGRQSQKLPTQDLTQVDDWLILGLSQDRKWLREICLRIAILQPRLSLMHRVINLLDHEKPEIRTIAGRILMHWQEVAVTPLCQAMNHPKDRIRRHAAWLLGQVGNKKAENSLVQALSDRSPVIRREAARSLTRLGWLPHSAKEALLHTIARQDWQMVMAQGHKDLETLLHLIKDYEPTMRLELIKLLKELKPRNLEDLSDYLDDPYWRVRKEAANLLHDLGWQPEKIAESVNYAIAHQDWQSLAAMGPEALEPLFALLEDKSQNIRSHAFETLSKIREQSAVQDLVNKLQAPSQYVRQAAADMLDKLAWQPKNEVQKAHYWLAKQGWQQVRSFGSRALEPLIERLEDSNQEIRRQVILLLRDIHDSRSTEALVSSLRDRSMALRSLAAQSLDDLNWEPQNEFEHACYLLAQQRFDQLVGLGEDAIDPLIDVLDDANEAFRQEVVLALKRITGRDFKLNQLDWSKWWQKSRDLL